MKKYIVMFSFALMAAFVIGCENHVTDGDGIVKSVRETVENDSGEGYGRKYKVTVRIEKDESTYVIYTNQLYTVGDIIKFKY